MLLTCVHIVKYFVGYNFCLLLMNYSIPIFLVTVDFLSYSYAGITRSQYISTLF